VRVAAGVERLRLGARLRVTARVKQACRPETAAALPMATA
jgi:hypothetical protein